MKKALLLLLTIVSLSLAYPAKGAETSPPFVIVASEDFSLWTKGSETVPHTEMEGGQARQFKIDEQITHQPGWMGNYIYQAGGCAYLKLNNDGGRAGHIHTPEMALYGEVKITFRAKILAGKQQKGQLWIALCDNTTGPIDNKDVDLTTEWQTFEMVSTRATFNEQNIFQLQPLDCDVLIDDIVVERRKSVLMPPRALNPVNTSSTSFRALWTPSPDATSYLFSIYYLDMPKDMIHPKTIVEGFDQIRIAEGGKIDTTHPNYPEGWSIDLSTNGSTDIIQTEGYYHSAPQALVLDAKGDQIITPKTPAPITNLSFWVRPSSIETEKDWNYTLLEVAVYSDGKWQAIANIPNTWMQAEGGFYTFDPEMLKTYDIEQVRFEVLQKNEVTFYIDDITYTYGSKPVPYYIEKNKEVQDTLYNIPSYDPSKEHFYYVQAKDGDILSEATYPTWVDGLIGVTPRVDQPTEVTETSFKAHWERLYNAGHYQLNSYRILKYLKEKPQQTVLHETFDQITMGSIEKPITPGEPVVQLAKEELTSSDWVVQLPAYAKGMIGVKETSPYSSTAGLVVSPFISLDAGGGAFEVAVQAQSTVAEDTLFVMIMRDYTDRQVEEYMPIAFPKEGGKVSSSVQFVAPQDLNARKNIRIGFMSARGKPFYIDEVSILQHIGEDETLYAPYKTSFPTENSIVLEHGMQGEDFVYNVQAFRTRFYQNYISEVSNFMTVENPYDTALEEPLQDTYHTLRIYQRAGGLLITAQTADIVSLYDLSGGLLRRLQFAEGESSFIPLPTGSYIIHSSRESYKVYVE